MFSDEHNLYLKKKKKEKRIILFFKVFIIVFIIFVWEVLAKYNLINTFLFSSPSLIVKTIVNLYKESNLLNHVFVTFMETVISFSVATLIGILVATFMWWNDKVAKILDPYLTVLNSLPKVSLGPLIIIWCGAGIKSIILMAILISVFNTIISMYNAFVSTDKLKITLLESFNARKYQIFSKLVFRSNLPTLINVLKINISMSLIGLMVLWRENGF